MDLPSLLRDLSGADNAGKTPAPSPEACFALWEEFAMPTNIREHSRLVAEVAAQTADSAGAEAIAWAVAAGLLHDIAKGYTILYGGNHSQLGGAIVLERFGDPLLAQSVVHHVFWPGELDFERHFLPLCLIYADKRVMHDRLVSLDERYADLAGRYGTTPFRLERVRTSHEQLKRIERGLSRFIGADLHAHPFDRRRLVS